MGQQAPAVIACDLLVAEVRQALERLGRDETDLVAIPSACHLGRGAKAHPVRVVEATRGRHPHSVGVCLSCVCPALPGRAQDRRLSVLSVQAQAELVLGADATRHALDQGDFLVLPGWLARWQAIVQQDWGFDQPTAAAFFAESTRRLLVLDTGARQVDPAQVQAFAAFVDRPAEVRFVGTSHLELLLERALSSGEHQALAAQQQQALARSRQRAAELACVAEYLTTLGQLLEETQVIAQLETTAQALFAADDVHVSLDGTGPERVADGFVQPITYRRQHLADLVVRRVAHAEAIPRYLPLARALCDASAIALHAARLFRQEQAASESLARRVEELDAFTSMVAHDLRGPLAAILGYTDLLVEVYGEQMPDEAVELGRRVIGVTQGMSDVIDDLLELARIGRQEVERQDIDTQALAEALARDFAARSSTPRGRIEVEGPLPALHTSAGWAREILENLVTNGLRYNDRPDPTVWISRWVEAEALSNTHGARLAGIVVRDNGRGIPPEEQGRAFDLFARLSSSADQEGTGIGLAIVRRIVEAESGTVRLESAVGRGTTFYVALPAAG